LPGGSRGGEAAAARTPRSFAALRALPRLPRTWIASLQRGSMVRAAGGRGGVVDPELRPRWFSANPDKAWGEKFFLSFVPVFLVYNAVVQQMGWLDVGTGWHVLQNLLMWVPYCLLLPAWLRRRSGPPWYQSYWFKFNVYMTVWIFYATYFHTEYFFEVLGLRYRFPQVDLYFDSALVGPDEAIAGGGFQKVPPGMYLNAIAFFIVYHTMAVVGMRRVRTMTLAWSAGAQRFAWVAIVLATALFFAWAETKLYITESAAANVWYVDLPRMLRWGSVFYAMYFVVSFPNVYRMDEAVDGPRWTTSRTVIEASFVAMLSLTLLDLWARFLGPITG
jgi:cycloeucalenol cycloisomerase